MWVPAAGIGIPSITCSSAILVVMRLVECNGADAGEIWRACEHWQE
jgi:hypothetical protein